MVRGSAAWLGMGGHPDLAYVARSANRAVTSALGAASGRVPRREMTPAAATDPMHPQSRRLRARVDNVTSSWDRSGDVRLPVQANMTFTRTCESIGIGLQKGRGTAHGSRDRLANPSCLCPALVG